ncbi:MAG: hypothetical protein E2O81_05335 [Betaproteobacteria bacterium]|nr:MAG: hypothetical protein E2O81_05335 [Betaproteobacteria bacterium]
MDATSKLRNHYISDDAMSFTVQVCSEDGRLLSEYKLSRTGDNVATLDAAEDRVRNNYSDYKGEPLIVFVSQETLTKFCQTQLKVVPDESETA